MTSKLVQNIHEGRAAQAAAQEYESGHVSAVKHPFLDVDVVDAIVVEEVLVVLGGALVSSGGLSSGLQFLAANILGSSTC